VNSNGFISARFDFTAFGEKISLGIGLRTIDQGYSAPQNSRQGYGLTETDSATGLDHTWFRKNENRAGRWTSPDPYKGSMSLGSSGSFNRYSYVENQPTNFVDPSGLLYYVVCQLWSWFVVETGEEVGPRFWVCTFYWEGPSPGGGTIIQPGDGGWGPPLNGGGETNLAPANDPDNKKTPELDECFQSEINTLNLNFIREQEDAENALRLSVGASSTAVVVNTVRGNVIGVGLGAGGGTVAITNFQNRITTLHANFRTSLEAAFKRCVNSAGATRTPQQNSISSGQERRPR